MEFEQEPDEVLLVLPYPERGPTLWCSIGFRRLWSLAPPPGIEEIPDDKLDDAVRSALQEIAFMPNLADKEGSWNDNDWRSHSETKLLDPLVGNTYEKHGDRGHNALYTRWRKKIYEQYFHVFFDAFSNIRHLYKPVKFPPHKSVLAIDSDGFRSLYDTDTLLLPIWVAPGKKLINTVRNVRFEWTDDSSEWQEVLWVKRSTEFELRLEGEVAHEHADRPQAVVLMCHLSASLNPESSLDAARTAKGGFEVSPYVQGQNPTEDEEDGGMPVRVLEADHLARAIFLKARDATADCQFDVAEPDCLNTALDVSDVVKIVTEPGELYAPLQEGCIRLLVLEPGSPDEELQTTLQEVPVGGTNSYEALSYTWGDSADKVPLKCHDSLRPIPRNLSCALRQLRHSKHPRYLWADSICINQDDIAERSQQVSIMNLIYQNATRVLSWLGNDEDGHAAVAFEAACRIVQSWKPKEKPLKSTSYREQLSPLPAEKLSHFRLVVTQEHVKSLRALFSADYFRRMWIIQELALARQVEVYWGKHHISWGLVGVCAAWCLTEGWRFHYGRPLTEAFNAFLIYVLPLSKWSGISMFPKLDLSVILGTAMDRFDATDPRDRIYALLGMPFSGSDPESGPLIRPDYSQSVRSVYVQAARRMIESDGHLRLLSAVQHGVEIDDTYPSWVPRWDRSPAAEPLALRQEQGYFANGGEMLFPTDSMFGADGESLILPGLECGSVTSASGLITKDNLTFGAMTTDSQRGALLLILQELFDVEKSFRTSWSGGIEQFIVFAFDDPEKQQQLVDQNEFKRAMCTSYAGTYSTRTFTSIVDGEKAVDTHLAELLLYWRERCSWDTQALESKDLFPIWEQMKASENHYDFERGLAAVNILLGRRIFYFGKGEFGLGPAGTKEGDVVAVLFGGLVPYVLRPCEAGRWKLVGECFIPTLMQGQAIEAAGLLSPGTFERFESGEIRLKVVGSPEEDQRFHRKIGDCGIREFEIR